MLPAWPHATMGGQNLFKKSSQTSASEVRGGAGPICSSVHGLQRPSGGWGKWIPLYTARKGTEPIWATCKMSHYLKEQPHSWHLGYFFLSPPLWLPGWEAAAHAPAACSFASVSPSIHSPMPRDSKALNKKEMEASGADGEIYHHSQLNSGTIPKPKWPNEGLTPNRGKAPRGGKDVSFLYSLHLESDGGKNRDMF